MKTIYVIYNEPVNKQYRLRRDENGNCIYSECGELDIKSFVNSFRNTSALDSILQRICNFPVREKVAYLNMIPNGAEGDTSVLPKDGTEAFILMQKYAHVLPEIGDRIKAGESVDSIVKSLFIAKTENVGKDNTDGKTESSND